MKAVGKGLLLAALQVGLVASVGAKLLYDRTTRPRVWALTAPYDPDLPIRGRYVSLQLVVDARGIAALSSDIEAGSRQAVNLAVENGRLVAQAKPEDVFEPADLHVRSIQGQGRDLVVLDEALAFFIPENGPDPSRRSQGEELWAEVTIPKKGPPRPIRLGVKRGDDDIQPLEAR